MGRKKLTAAEKAANKLNNPKRENKKKDKNALLIRFSVSLPTSTILKMGKYEANNFCRNAVHYAHQKWLSEQYSE